MKNERKKILPGSPEWEAICNNCGRCCYEKVDYRGKIFYTSKPCRFLDSKQLRCRIYEEREQKHSDCARLTPELVAAGILPADCPYVAELEDYQPPTIDED